MTVLTGKLGQKPLVVDDDSVELYSEMGLRFSNVFVDTFFLG